MFSLLGKIIIFVENKIREKEWEHMGLKSSCMNFSKNTSILEWAFLKNSFHDEGIRIKQIDSASSVLREKNDNNSRNNTVISIYPNFKLMV